MSPVTISTSGFFPTDPNPTTSRYTFAELVAGRDDEFPVLARASKNVVPAANLTVEWLSAGKLLTNFCQIVHSCDIDEFLACCERILIDGKPECSRLPSGDLRRCCGGYKHYLGRELMPDDVLTLRPLRGPFLRERPRVVWLAEFSLQVVPVKTRARISRLDSA